MRFDGATYEPQDRERLETALGRVYQRLKDGEWHTLADLAQYAGCTEQGASARIRDLRKEKFRAEYPNGGVERRRVKGRAVFHYQMKPPVEKKQKALFGVGGEEYR